MKLSLPVFHYNIQNSSKVDTLDLYIDGAIVDASDEAILKSWFGDDTSMSYKTFRNTINERKPKTLNIFVNSPGGSVADALAMHDYMVDLQNDGIVINVRVCGLSASAATYFQLAVPKENRTSTQNSFLLIHNVSGGIYGDLREMQSYVNQCQKMNDAITNLYEKETSLTKNKLVDMMNEETLMTADEMLEYGFIGSIVERSDAKNKVDLSHLQFKNKAILNVYDNNFSTSKKSKKFENMEKTLLQKIEEGFNNVATKLGLKDKVETPEGKTLINDFAKTISDAFEAEKPTQESINILVQNAMKQENLEVPKSVNTAIETAVNAAKEGFINKTDLTAQLNTFKGEVVAAVSNKTVVPGTQEDGAKKNLRTAKTPFVKDNYEE